MNSSAAEKTGTMFLVGVALEKFVLLLRRLTDLTSTIKCSCHFPVIFEKRIVALKLLQCSVRKTNTESGFVRGGPKSNSISACWLGGGVRFHVE